METSSTAATAHAYAIYVDSLCDGSVPLEHNAAGVPVVYPTLEAAQRVIAEDAMEHLRQYLAGEREFEDAIHTEEYACAVEVLPDGALRPITA